MTEYYGRVLQCIIRVQMFKESVTQKEVKGLSHLFCATERMGLTQRLLQGHDLCCDMTKPISEHCLSPYVISLHWIVLSGQQVNHASCQQVVTTKDGLMYDAEPHVQTFRFQDFSENVTQCKFHPFSRQCCYC